jgi:Uma2 family endonuclease
MYTITRKILKSPRLPFYLEEIEQFYSAEQKRRQEFYNAITESEKVEFINGKKFMQSPAKNKHLEISSNLLLLLKTYVVKYDLGIVHVEKAMIACKRNDYEPDLCFFKKDKSDKFDKNTMIFPPPDLVAEILSKSTEKRDRGIKFIDYAINGIPEYWIIDP